MCDIVAVDSIEPAHRPRYDCDLVEGEIATFMEEEYVDNFRTMEGFVVECRHLGTDWEPIEEPEKGKALYLSAGTQLRVVKT